MHNHIRVYMKKNSIGYEIPATYREDVMDLYNSYMDSGDPKDKEVLMKLVYKVLPNISKKEDWHVTAVSDSMVLVWKQDG